MITEIGLDYFRQLPYTKSCNNYLLFLCAIFFFEHVTAIMSGNCVINFYGYHFNKILVVFHCFGEIKKFYLFLCLSGIFTAPLRVFLGNMGVFLGKCMDRENTYALKERKKNLIFSKLLVMLSVQYFFVHCYVYIFLYSFIEKIPTQIKKDCLKEVCPVTFCLFTKNWTQKKNLGLL